MAHREIIIRLFSHRPSANEPNGLALYPKRNALYKKPPCTPLCASNYSNDGHIPQKKLMKHITFTLNRNKRTANAILRHKYIYSRANNTNNNLSKSINAKKANVHNEIKRNEKRTENMHAIMMECKRSYGCVCVCANEYINSAKKNSFFRLKNESKTKPTAQGHTHTLRFYTLAPNRKLIKLIFTYKL